MMNEYILTTLLQCPLFKGMSEMEIDILMQSVKYRIIYLDKNDIYALAGSPCKYADIIIRGEMVARMVGLSGKYVEVSRLQSGNIIAPAFIFAKDNSMPVSVETDTAVEILRMMPSELKILIDTNEQIRDNFIATLSNINVFLTRKMRMLSLLTVNEKVAFYIIDTAIKQKSMTIHLEKSRQEIADSFGIQKFSLMRSLSEFASSGAISIEGKTITILNRSLLK